MIIVSMGFSFIVATFVQIFFGTTAQSMPSVIPVKSYTILNAKINSVQL